MKSFSATSFFSPLLLTLLSFVLIFSSCATAEDDGVDPNIEENDRVTVSFDLEGEGGAPITYAINGDPERNISELDILLFDLDGKLAYAPVKGTISAMNPTTGKSQVTATVMRAHYGNIIILANARGMVNAALNLSTPLAVGMPQDEAMKLFHLTLPGKWDTDTNSGEYIGIPMFGETGYVNVNSVTSNVFNTTLLRMLARVDVSVTTAVQPHFKLKSIRVYNRNSVGMLAKSATVGEPNLPAEPQKIADPLTYDGDEITDPNSRGEIYLFESAITNLSGGTERLPEATCLVVGGFYSADGVTMDMDTDTELFYRVDFAQMDVNDIKHFYNIIRNHQYNISIVSVTGPGLEDPDEALNTELSRIDVVVVDWGNGGEIGGDIDGQDVLRVDPGSLTLSYLERTTASLDNKASVSSTHADGWYISKITELVGGVENDISVDGWLSTSLPLNAIQTEDYTFSTILSENDGATRVGYIYINSGPRMSYKMKVTQRAFGSLYIDSIQWDDYDGVNDNDAGFTSITVKDGANISHTRSVTRGGVISPEIEIDAAMGVSSVSVTYKDTTNPDVHTSKYSFDAVTNKLVITDGTIISKPIHLDKIRKDIDNSFRFTYTQINDIDLQGYTNLNGETDNWVPIGTGVKISTTSFRGYYNGGSGNGGTGFVIKNLNINRPTEDYVGLFGASYISKIDKVHIVSGTIMGESFVGAICGYAIVSSFSGNTNLANITGSNYVGGLAGNIGVNGNVGTLAVDNCSNGGAVTALQGDYVGGIVAYAKISFSKCTNTGTIIGDNSGIGGIVGYYTTDDTNALTMSDCRNEGIVKGTSTADTASGVGGIAGHASFNITISGCINVGVIQGKSKIGGIAGASGCSIINCINEGALSPVIGSTDNKDFGGISGYNNSGTIQGCKNLGAITGFYSVGGICGLMNTYLRTEVAQIIDCHNFATGEVKGAANMGGICAVSGGISETIIPRISGCTNAAPITVETITGATRHGSAAGICGDNYAIIDDCSNSGVITSAVTGTQYLGGITGSSSGANALLNKCQNLSKGKVSSSGEFVGGISGLNTSSGKITTCTNISTVTGTSTASRYVGGIAGRNLSGCLIQSASNSGAVTSPGNYVGGVCGNNVAGSVLSCSNEGTVESTGATSASVGGICGSNSSISTSAKVDNCTNYATGTVKGYVQVGGICGYNSSMFGLINSGKNYATVTGTSSVGGICGVNNGNNIKLSTNAGAVKGDIYVGGICGVNRASIEECSNAYTVTGRECVGGIAGSNEGLMTAVTSSDNQAGGEVSGTGGDYIGGVVGRNLYALIRYCSNDAPVKSTGLNYVGGIAGSNDSVGGGTNYASITDSHNLTGGVVTSDGSNIGGIAGDNNFNSIISGCSNKASVTALANTAGGIVGYDNGGLVSSCFNTGAIKSADYTGGIVGHLDGPEVRACYNIGAVTATVSNVGAIVGAITAGSLAKCYFGEAANDMAAVTGTFQFADGVWPEEDMPGWELHDASSAPDEYWMDLGSWGTTYPALR